MHIPKAHSILSCFLILFLSLSFVEATPETDENRKSGCILRCNNSGPLIQGAELPSTNGIYLNARDELFVTSVVGRSITQLDPSTGRIIARFGPKQGIESPDDLIFDSAGNLYWTAFLTGEVGRLTPGGEKSTVASLGPGVNAITLSTDETKLYVSRVFLADEVWEIDLSGSDPPRLVAQNVGGFNGMDIGPDGRLYGPLWYHGQVASIDIASGLVEVVADGLSTPAAVKFNHSGELFVVDQSLGRVSRVDIENGKLELVAYIGIGADNLAFDSHDQLFVTNATDSTIRRFARTSHRLMPNKNSGSCPHLILSRDCNRTRHFFPPQTPKVSTFTRGGLTTSSGIALQKVNGRVSLFVADVYSIKEFSPLSGRQRSIAYATVDGATGLSTPFSLSSYGSYLLATSWFGNAVQIWEPESKKLIGEYRDFSVPINAIGFGNGLAVAELGSGCVMQQPFDNSDRTSFGCDFQVPAGLAKQGGRLFLSDWATGSVWQIARDYEKIVPPILITSGLQQPEGMAVSKKGTLLVVEAGMDRLLEIDILSGATTTFADELQIGNSATPGYPPTWVFNSVAVDNCGAVYINTDRNRSVRRIANKTALYCEP